MPNPILHIELGCRDKEATAKFYGDLFGWKTSPYGEHALKFSTGAQVGVSGHITALGHEPHLYTNFYVGVDDIEASVEQAKSLGAEVFVGPLDTPDGGRFAWLKDPEGRLFAMLENG